MRLWVLALLTSAAASAARGGEDDEMQHLPSTSVGESWVAGWREADYMGRLRNPAAREKARLEDGFLNPCPVLELSRPHAHKHTPRPSCM
jgi:hypothetical protein